MAIAPLVPPPRVILEGTTYEATSKHEWTGSARKLCIGYAAWAVLWGGIAYIKPEMRPVSLILGLATAPLPAAAHFTTRWIYSRAKEKTSSPPGTISEGSQYEATPKQEWTGSVIKLCVGYAAWATLWGGLAIIKPEMRPVSLIAGLATLPLPAAAHFRTRWNYTRTAKTCQP